MTSPPFRFEALGTAHRRAEFSCGETALDEYIHRYARQQQERGFNRTYVAVPDDLPARIAGFYSINAASVLASELPDGLKLPRYPVPILRIGRLAVDRRFQGTGLGRRLLRHGLALAVELSARVGIYAVVVDAKHERAAAFYRKLGFAPFAARPLSMYLPLATLADAVHTGE